MSERLAGVRGRERAGILPLTEFEVHHHVKRTLKGSEWEVVGHQSEEQRRRYRHLYPATIREAVKGVFG